MKLIIQPGKEAEWTLPLLLDPSKYLGESIHHELQEHHSLAAFAEHIRSLAEMWAANDSVTLSRINDIFASLDKRQAIDDLVRLYQEGGLNIPLVPEEPVTYKLLMHLILTPEFYVQPFREDATRSNVKEIAHYKKSTLIQRIWQDLPTGYGIKVDYPGPRQTVGGVFEIPHTEPVDLELRGDLSADILRAAAVFANRERYDNAYLFMQNNPETLARQAFYLARLRKAGTEVTVGDYSKIFTIPHEQAQKEVKEMADLKLVRLIG